MGRGRGGLKKEETCLDQEFLNKKKKAVGESRTRSGVVRSKVPLESPVDLVGLTSSPPNERQAFVAKGD